jgi:hypothetical protein
LAQHDNANTLLLLNFTIIGMLKSNLALACHAEEQPVPQGGKATDYSVK